MYNNRLNLIEYIPQVLQDVEEYKAVLEGGEQEEINTLWQELGTTLDNQFIANATEQGVARYEKMLGIIPNSYDTLIARKSRILIRWNDSIPYTMEILKQKLTVLCGEGNFSISTDFANYAMTITVALPLSGQVDELEKMLSRIIPANLVVTTVNNLVRDVSDDMYQGTASVSGKRYNIDQEEGE